MEKINKQHNTLDMSAGEFRQAGHVLIEQIADFIEQLPNKKVTTGVKPAKIREILGNDPLPLNGDETLNIIDDATKLLFEHSLFNGHPKFWGYITSSAAPIGALADLLAASINPNVGAFTLSPMATEIERQSVRWLAELINYDVDCGGLFVSGGNMANFLGFLAARKNKIQGDIRKNGLPLIPGKIKNINNENSLEKKQFTIYCSKGTHTWIQKAADLFGHGTDSIRWIELNEKQQLETETLRKKIEEDIQSGHKPFLVVGNAGSVSTGVIDPLHELALLCKEKDIWLHVDGAYGAPAASLPELHESFNGLSLADSIALDPHKWLYSPLEAGCILVKDPRHLHDAFNFNPEYYNFGGDGEDAPLNFHEYGMQNSRGFRALKVWMSLKQVGKEGLNEMIRKDIYLAKKLFDLCKHTKNIEPVSQSLSITTFRYNPGNESAEFLNQLNEKLLNRLQAGGEVFLSNAIVNGNYCMRVCIVNFRTNYPDLETLVNVVLREGENIYKERSLELG